MSRAVVDADGVVEVDNIYDEHGRVTTAAHAARVALVRYVYLPGRVTVDLRRGRHPVQHLGRTTSAVGWSESSTPTSTGSRWPTTPHGNVVMVTERDGATTVHEYDERGRWSARVTPTGADLHLACDEHDRVTGRPWSHDGTDANDSDAATLSRMYDGGEPPPGGSSSTPRAATPADLGAGLLTQVVDPIGVEVRFTHDEHGDLVATTDAARQLGAPRARRVAAAWSLRSPRPVTSPEYVYDPAAGLLAERIDPDGATYRYEHTAAGRLSATIDPTGARTEIEYGAHGEETPHHRPARSGGHPAAATTSATSPRWSCPTAPPGGSPTTRCRVSPRRWTPPVPRGARSTTRSGPHRATSPTGESLSMSTDAVAGTATVSEGAAAGLPTSGADGPMTGGIRVDRLGRLIASEQPDGSTVLTRYDRCGRAVELRRRHRCVSRVRRDAAGRATSVTRPGGGVVGYEYDRCGRPSAVIDERRTHRATATTSTADRRADAADRRGGDLDGVRRVRRVTGAGSRASGTDGYSYDAAGRVAESRDPQLGRRRFVYDDAGQLVQVVNGNGGVTR